MKPFTRGDRVGGEIQKTLSDILARKIKDPRLSLATITGVKMSSDLRLARIYFSISGTATARDEALIGFKAARGFLKRILARQLGLRYMPDLTFFYDDSFDYGAHMDSVLKSIETDNEPDNKSFTQE